MQPYCKFNGIGIEVIPCARNATALTQLATEETVQSNASKGMVLERKLLEADKRIISRIEEIVRLNAAFCVYQNFNLRNEGHLLI